jgi:hypothetical protein
LLKEDHRRERLHNHVSAPAQENDTPEQCQDARSISKEMSGYPLRRYSGSGIITFTNLTLLKFGAPRKSKTAYRRFDGSYVTMNTVQDFFSLVQRGVFDTYHHSERTMMMLKRPKGSG